MKTIYFVINHSSTHLEIINTGSGASEFLFYLLISELSKDYSIIVYNKTTSCKIDNVEYKYLPDNNIPNLENIDNSFICIQRNFNIGVEICKTYPNNKYFIWSHDYLHDIFPNLSAEYSAKEINSFFSKNRIKIIAVSNFHKKNILSRFPDVEVIPIYNALFENYFPKVTNIVCDKDKFLFASNWGKGLDKILNIGKVYYEFNKNFKLLLIKPNYCDWEPDLKEYPFIEKRGCITDKKNYCRLIQSCCAVFTTSYSETFGCVFAEALHLGVPVIGDNSIEAGFQEIIPEKYMCNFNNPSQVINVIQKIRINQYKVSLDYKFYSNSVVNEWVKLINL